MALINNNKKALGLDISDLILRAALLKGQGRSSSFEAYSQTAVTEGLIKNGEIIDPAALTEIIKKMFSKTNYGHFSTKQVVASLPERKSFTKVIEVPPVESQQLEDTIKWEASQHIPYANDEIYINWRIIKTGGVSDSIRVLVCAIPKNIADSYTNVLESADLKPIALVIESFAIANALIPEKEENNTTALIIDLGLRRSTFFVFDQGAVTFSASSKNVSGAAMTKMVSEKLKLSQNQAEDAKRLCGLDPNRGRAAIPKILMPYIDQIGKQITKMTEYYQKISPGAQKINSVILVGGGANLRNIGPELSKRTNLRVYLGNPWIKLDQLKRNKIIPSRQHLSQFTVLGLSLMGMPSALKDIK